MNKDTIWNSKEQRDEMISLEQTRAVQHIDSIEAKMIQCLMSDDTDEVFDFSNLEFTREYLVTVLNDMFHEYKKFSQSLMRSKLKRSQEMINENQRLAEIISSWTKSSTSLQKLQGTLKPSGDKSGLGMEGMKATLRKQSRSETSSDAEKRPLAKLAEPEQNQLWRRQHQKIFRYKSSHLLNKLASNQPFDPATKGKEILEAFARPKPVEVHC
ncbi:hypothetical protein F511_40696 [Dorcoceras hygrometricum]|uniref:Uncharacterized protein n=1 Tax=Dorcoceras hygrometricum TaxID=472368 RepID=A0A2Z7A7C1_9LAMI|nr:hypothetical protein F511_40696 [Dorcoceras hygrometricum]